MTAMPWMFFRDSSITVMLLSKGKWLKSHKLQFAPVINVGSKTSQ